MSIALSIGLSLGGQQRAGITIRLDDRTIPANAQVGDLVGNLTVENGIGVYTFSITTNPGSDFAIDGTRLEVAGALAAGTVVVVIEADNGIDEPTSQDFSITITP